MQKCIVPQMPYLHMWQTHAGEKQQFAHCKNGNNQFKGGRSPNADNIQSSKNGIDKNGDGKYRELRKKDIEIRTNGKSDGRRCKNEFDVLRHAGEETKVYSECKFCIVKSTSSF